MRGALLALLLGAACRTVPVTPPSLLAELHAGRHLAGVPVGLGPSRVLNAEDFVYDAKLSPDARLAGVSRLGLKSYHLALHPLEGADTKARHDVALNPHEFDVDALEFSPDGTKVATVSRDGALRIVGVDGVHVAAWLTEEPLVSVAWHPRGDVLALGSARGLVTLVSFPALGHVAEVRAHADEVRALAFTPRGELVSGGWDKRLVRFELAPASSAPGQVRAHVTKKNGVVSFRGVLDRSASVMLALDARAPLVLARPSVAQTVGIDVASLTDSVTVPTAFGPQVVKVAKGRTLSIKGLVLTQVDVGVCEACVPPETQAVLGGPVLERLDFAFDDGVGEVVLSPKAGAVNVEAQPGQTLRIAAGFSLPGAINDFALDASGTIAGVALGNTKAERTKAVYDREKKGEVEPTREWDCAARVEVATGRVLEKKQPHRGVVATAAVSPDGQTLVSGGWDKRVVVSAAQPLVDERYGWAIRRVRFSADGRFIVIAAWTPQNPLGDHQTSPSAVVTEVVYGADATVK